MQRVSQFFFEPRIVSLCRESSAAWTPSTRFQLQKTVADNLLLSVQTDVSLNHTKGGTACAKIPSIIHVQFSELHDGNYAEASGGWMRGENREVLFITAFQQLIRGRARVAVRPAFLYPFIYPPFDPPPIPVLIESSSYFIPVR